jgi:hypothetical protein
MALSSPIDVLRLGSGQSFVLTLTDTQLTDLVFQAAKQGVEADYDRLTIDIFPDRLAIYTFVRTEAAGAGLDIEAEGIPSIVDSQIRFQLTTLRIEDRYAQLTQDLTQIVVNTLNKSLYLLWPSQRSEVSLFSFRATGIHLGTGEMIIEGIVN